MVKKETLKDEFKNNQLYFWELETREQQMSNVYENRNRERRCVVKKAYRNKHVLNKVKAEACFKNLSKHRNIFVSKALKKYKPFCLHFYRT